MVDFCRDNRGRMPKPRTPAGEAAREWLNREIPFTHANDALDETMTHEDAAWLTYTMEDIEHADLAGLAEIERKAGYESPVVRAAIRVPVERKRKELGGP